MPALVYDIQVSTIQLVPTFTPALTLQVRGRLLTQDLPAVILAKRNAFDSFAINLNNAAAKAADGEPRPPRMSDAARIPQRSSVLLGISI